MRKILKKKIKKRQKQSKARQGEKNRVQFYHKKNHPPPPPTAHLPARPPNLPGGVSEAAIAGQSPVGIVSSSRVPTGALGACGMIMLDETASGACSCDCMGRTTVF